MGFVYDRGQMSNHPYINSTPPPEFDGPGVGYKQQEDFRERAFVRFVQNMVGASLALYEFVSGKPSPKFMDVMRGWKS